MNDNPDSQPLLHYKTGQKLERDQGAGYGETGNTLSTIGSSASWQTLGEFDPRGWARITLMGLTNKSGNKLRFRQGYRTSAGVFVPLTLSNELPLTADTPEDNLSAEVVGLWADVQMYQNAGTNATVDVLACGKRVS